MTETELEYQFCFNCNDRKNCYTKPKDCTRIKEEIGLQDMTNEEWIKSLDTEQLATFLAIVQYDGTDLTLKKNHVEKWVAWLKEKHE